MNEDFRPPLRPRPMMAPNTRTSRAHPFAQPAIVRPSTPEQLDEQHIEQEFGPAPDGSTAPSMPSSSQGSKLPPLTKLLPALTPRRGHPGRKRLLIISIASFVVLTGASASAYYFLERYVPAVPGLPAIHAKKPAPKVTTVASTLTGLPVDPSVNNRPVTAVMIENSLDARPQSGLDQAGVVFEALAEGGVTRFMALFQDTQPDYIGPVRSARPYYVQWALGFDAAYAHVGGSPDALSDITSWHVKDLNQFYNAGAYQRISSRYAPHNVYTSIAQLNQVENAKGFGKSIYTGFARKAEAPSKAPNATSIDLTFSGFYYDAHFDYDAATNTYKRSESGKPHMELHKDGSQVQIAPKVVVAMIVPEHNGKLDSSGAYYADYATIGSGPITVFQDGVAQTGTWSKAGNNASLIFTDDQGQPFKLNAGQTWISAVTASSKVTYK